MNAMTLTPSLRGLYAITDAGLVPGHSLCSQVEAAIRGGARVIQYRDKGKDQTRRIREAGLLLSICRAHRVPLIINDDLTLAEAVGADGIHLGRDDVPLRLARERLGSAAIIGVSCYNQMERARRAESDGADYVAFGRFFASLTKPHAVSADIDLLREARAEIRLPLVAIGGITPENGSLLVRAGADMLAVIRGVFGRQDIATAARRFSRLFEPEAPCP